MNDKQDYNGKNGGKYPLLVALIGAFLGSSGSVALVFNTPLGEQAARPDPFTGAQGATLATRIDRLQSDLDEIKRLLNRGILPRAEERITNLEKHHTELEREFDDFVRYHNENFVPARHLEPRRKED